MLTVTIPGKELFNDATQEFIQTKDTTLTLEHSLVSLTKWEMKWNKPFIGTEKTDEETLDYVRCMTITQNVDKEVYNHLDQNTIETISAYLEAPMTATVFSQSTNGKGSGRSEVITSEIIYYWMFGHNLPKECEKWHLNRLLTLIRVCNTKGSEPKKMSNAEILRQNRELNAKRRAQMQTKG